MARTQENDTPAERSGEEDTGDRDSGARRWPWILGGLVLLALGAGLYMWQARSERVSSEPAAQPPLVAVATAQAAERFTIDQTGFVRPRAQVTVAPEVSGRITEIGDSFEVGARVPAGDMLIRIGAADYESDVSQAAAAVQGAEASVSQARVNRARQEELEAEGFAAEQRLQEARVAVATAEADLAAARAQLTRARQRLEDTTLTAPFDAVVSAERAALGQFVQPGSDLGTLVAADSARIRMGLLPDDIALVGQAEATIGSTVQLFASGPAGAPLGSGTVTQVSPEIEEQTRTLPLIVAVEDPFGDRLARPLRIDELVRLELPVTLPDGGAVRIPAAALKGADTLWRVADGRLQRLSPTVLVREADALVVVADRIAAGDTVMISDLPAAFDGQEVRTDDGTTDGEGG